MRKAGRCRNAPSRQELYRSQYVKKSDQEKRAVAGFGGLEESKRRGLSHGGDVAAQAALACLD